MSPAELLEVDDSAGPEAVELLAELAFQVAEEAGLGADEADFLADEEFGAGGEEGGLAEATQHQVEHGSQVTGISLAMAQVGLQTGQLDLVGVEEAVLEGRLGLAVDVRAVVVHQGPCPGLVVDAGRFVAEKHQQRVVLGDQTIGRMDKLVEASPGGGQPMGAHQFQARCGTGGGPMDVLADVQEGDQRAVEAYVSQTLAEGDDVVGIVTFQVAPGRSSDCPPLPPQNRT
jgi:hypothetical protein